MNKPTALFGALTLITTTLSAACSSSAPTKEISAPETLAASNVGQSAAALTAPDGYTNVALHHMVVPSSIAPANGTQPASVASWLTDGNLDGNLFTTIYGENDPWITVALRYPRQVDFVDVSGYVAYGAVELLDASYNVVASQPVGFYTAGSHVRVSFPNAPPSSYVRLHQQPGFLAQVSEIQAYARVIPASQFPLKQHPSSSNMCWKQTKGRGAGTIPTSCGAGQEKNGALCYPVCNSGYTGVGPVCWQDCPSGWTNTGAFCHHDADIISADNSRCPGYDLCGLTFAPGCSVCPSGYHNDGCTCRIDSQDFAKDTYTRTAGTLMGCGSGQEEQAGLCYPTCLPGSYGVGPVCWSSCGGDHPVDCIAGCATDSAACQKFLTDATIDITQMVVNISLMVQSFGESAEAMTVTREAVSLTAEQTVSVRSAFKQLLVAQAKDLSEDVASGTAQALVGGLLTGTIDWTQIDPTGIAAVILVFNQPMC